MPMKSWVKFDSPQNITGASQQNSGPALSSWGENVKNNRKKRYSVFIQLIQDKQRIRKIPNWFEKTLFTPFLI